jgi:hypothetical protein
MASIVSVGRIDERGYLRGMDRRGYTHAKCLNELLANALDALNAAERDADGYVHMIIEADKTYISDNGCGMNREDIGNMFAMHRENHADDHSRGVSGIGAKPALSILSNKRHVILFTRKIGYEYLRVDVPWDIIHRDGVYTDMVTIRKMTDDEIATFGYNGRDSGTTICFPNSASLKKVIEDQISVETNPLDRIGIVFGRDIPQIAYKPFEGDMIPVPKYNYFAGNDTEFYTGVRRDYIDVYCNGERERFIWRTSDGEEKECRRLAANRYAKEATEVVENKVGYRLKGTLEVLSGLRYDRTIFDPDSPALPDAKERLDYLTKECVGEEHREFNTRTKLVRNLQTIGTIPLPDVKESNARACGQSMLSLRMLQCEVLFNPVSSQDNVIDKIMLIQENKNQHDGSSLPLHFRRLIKAIRDAKVSEIWAYFESRVAPAPVPEPEPVVAVHEPVVAVPEPEPVVAVPEPVVAVYEPVIAVPEPEPVIAVPEPEPVIAVPEPEPAAQLASVPVPESVTIPPVVMPEAAIIADSVVPEIRPMSDTQNVLVNEIDYTTKEELQDLLTQFQQHLNLTPTSQFVGNYLVLRRAIQLCLNYK